ncbi:MAG: hypothetical protein HZB92_05885 [Euryarchaeota archaeon]|nr:hypothetical protein [Euryarchaeota archaeon]
MQSSYDKLREKLRVNDVFVGFSGRRSHQSESAPGGSVINDKYKRSVDNLTNNISDDWIAYNDIDHDNYLSAGDEFIISTSILQDSLVMGYTYGSSSGRELYIAFSDKENVEDLGMIIIGL